MASKTSQAPQIEIVIEDVPLPADFASSLQSHLISVTSKDYSTVANTWGFTAIQPQDASLVDIIREDFADGVSFQKLNIANEVAGFAQSYDGQALLVIDKSLSTIIIRRNKETSFPIALLPELRVILERNPQACSPSFNGYLAISNDTRHCCFYAGTDEVFFYIQRSHRIPSWMTLKLDWPISNNSHQNNAGRTLSCRFIQTEAGTTVSCLVAAFYSKSEKTGQNILAVSSFLIRPLLDQAHFLSRPQCGEVKQYKFIFQLRLFGAMLVPNHQHGSLMSSISNSGSMLAIALNQNQAGFSANNSRLLFIGLHVRALVVCRLHKILDNQSDCITAIEWLRSDLMCAVCTARGRFAIFAAASGALRLVLTSDIPSSVATDNRKEEQSQSVELLQPSSNNVLLKNRLAVHVCEPVFLCYSLVQAGHVLLRNVPPRVKIIRDYYNIAAEYAKGGDFMSAGRLNLSAWGLVATSLESFNDRQLSVIRQISTQTFQICLSFIKDGVSLVMVFERFAAFVTELRNLLGFSVYNEDAFSLLAETIALSILLAFDYLLPSTTGTKQLIASNSKKGPPPDILTQLFRLVNKLDTEIRQCHRHLDAASSDVKNIQVLVAAKDANEDKEVFPRNKPPRDSFPALSWALNFYERLYLECCRQILTTESNDEQALMLNQYRPLLQKIQAACALVCPIGKCVAALADFKVAPGVDNFLDGNIEGALETWSTTFADLQATSDDYNAQRNLVLSSLFGLLTSNRVSDAVILADLAVLNIICPVRRKVEFSTDESGKGSVHIVRFSDAICNSPRLELLLGPLCNFVGSLAATLARWVVNEPICVPPTLQPNDVEFGKISKKNDNKTDSQRLVCVDPSFVAKADSFSLLNTSKIMIEFILTGRYNDAIRFAQQVGNNSMAIVLALAVHLFSTSIPEESPALNLRPEFTPTRQIRSILNSYTKPIDSILDFMFLVSTISSGNSNVSASTLQDHVAVSSGAVDIKFDQLPKIPEQVLSSALLLSTICQKSAICHWSRTLCDLLHKSCYPLLSLFFSQLLSKRRNAKTPLHVPPLIYCTQIFDGISAEDTVLTLVHARLGDLHRKMTADLVDSFIATLKCSKTLNVLVAVWKSHLTRIYMVWEKFGSSLNSLVEIENPNERLFTPDVVAFDDKIPVMANSTIEILSEDFSSLLATLALWYLVDIITANWNNYLEILENDGGNTAAILLKESELMECFVCLLPFSLLFSSAQNGKSLCFDVIVKVVSQFTPCDRVARLFGYASGLLVELFGEELYDTFISPRLEPILDSWKGIADKETDTSLIFIFANQLKNGRAFFAEFRRITSTNPSSINFLSNFASLLLSSPLMLPFVANLFNVRFNPIASLSLCRSWNEMLIPENWSSVMSSVLQESSAELTTLTTKSLIANCLEAFMGSYPDNSSFTGHLAVGNMYSLFKHVSAVVRESSVWKAGVGGRTLAELERRRGDSNMAEFYQLMRAVDYPRFVTEIRAICNRFAEKDFSQFSCVANKWKLSEGKVNPNLIIHIFWMREVRPSSQDDQPIIAHFAALPAFPEDEEEEGATAPVVPVEVPKENVTPEEEEEEKPVPDVRGLWDSLKPKQCSETSSSSSSASQSSTTDLSMPGQIHQQPPILPLVGSASNSGNMRRALSSSHSSHTTSDSNNARAGAESGRQKTGNVGESSQQGKEPKAPESVESFHLSEVQGQFSNSVSQVLQHQAASFEAILTNFSQQQTALVAQMVSIVTSAHSTSSSPAKQEEEIEECQQPQPLHQQSQSRSKHKAKKKMPSSSSSSTDPSSGPSSESFPHIPKLLTFSCPTSRKVFQNVVPTNQTAQRIETDMPRLLTLNQVDFTGLTDENYLSEERLVSVFKAAASFVSEGPPQTSLVMPGGRFGDSIPPLIGVGMLRRFRMRRRQQSQPTQTTQQQPVVKVAEEPTVKPVVEPAPQKTHVTISYQDDRGPSATVYKSTVGVNTEKLRMVSVGITAKTTQPFVAMETDRSQEGIFDGLLQQSQRAIQNRQDEFGSLFLGPQALNETQFRPPADIGFLNYFNRRPMPPFNPTVPALPKPSQQKILITSGTETDPEKKPQQKIVDAMERFTTARSGLDENLRLVNAESFAVLEDHLGLAAIQPLSSQFVSVSDVAKRDLVQRNVQDAEAELDLLLENARKTIGWRSDQRTAETQTEQVKKQDEVADNWDVPAPRIYDSGLKLVVPVVSGDRPARSVAVDNAVILNWSQRLDAIDQAGKVIRNEMKQIADFSTNLIPGDDKPKVPCIELPEQTPRTDADFGTQPSLALPIVFKKSVSFSESLVESPRQGPKPQETEQQQPANPTKTQPPNHKSSSSPTTPSTPHLDVVQLCDTGSLQPRSTARTPRPPRTPESAQPPEKKRSLLSAVQLSASTGASSTTTTTPSEMLNTLTKGRSSRPPVKKATWLDQSAKMKQMMQQRLEDASKLVSELMTEQEKMRSRSKERWSQPAEVATSGGKKTLTGKLTLSTKPTLSETERREAAVLESQFRDILLGFEPEKQRTVRNLVHQHRDIKQRPQESNLMREKEEQLEWLLEREADLAKPPSEPSEGEGNDNEVEFAGHLRKVDPAIAELLDKYSVHSGSVFSIVDWDEVDQVLAHEGDQELP